MTSEGRQRRRLTATVTDLDVGRQRALLISVQTSGMTADTVRFSLVELERLTETAGSDPIHSEIVRRDQIRPATFIGAGQAEDLATLSSALDIDVVVFDNDLSPAQQRNLQSLFGCDVVDRVALILDIFAQHAVSREGMLQVELALLQYHLPRLRGKGIELSRQAGGIGTRGPGETKLETDRRRIQQRIAKLTRDLRDLEGTRATQRKSRQRAGLPLVALVGYTNAGKSTLLRQLTEAEVLIQDQLFSTLGSTVRRSALPNGDPVLYSDTVGFVRRLPHELIEAFRSTLEETLEADLLLHVVDAADANAEDQITAVREVLTDIGAGQLPELIVFNKTDVAEPAALKRLQKLYPESVSVSGETGENCDELVERVEALLRGRMTEVKVFVPYSRPEVLAALHRVGEIISEEHGQDGTVARVMLFPDAVAEFADVAVR